MLLTIILWWLFLLSTVSFKILLMSFSSDVRTWKDIEPPFAHDIWVFYSCELISLFLELWCLQKRRNCWRSLIINGDIWQQVFSGILENALAALIFTFSFSGVLAICPSCGHSYIRQLYDITLLILYIY